MFCEKEYTLGDQKWHDIDYIGSKTKGSNDAEETKC